MLDVNHQQLNYVSVDVDVDELLVFYYTDKTVCTKTLITKTKWLKL